MKNETRTLYHDYSEEQCATMLDKIIKLINILKLNNNIVGLTLEAKYYQSSPKQNIINLIRSCNNLKMLATKNIGFTEKQWINATEHCNCQLKTLFFSDKNLDFDFNLIWLQKCTKLERLFINCDENIHENIINVITNSKNLQCSLRHFGIVRDDKFIESTFTPTPNTPNTLHDFPITIDITLLKKLKNLEGLYLDDINANLKSHVDLIDFFKHKLKILFLFIPAQQFTFVSNDTLIKAIKDCSQLKEIIIKRITDHFSFNNYMQIINHHKNKLTVLYFTKDIHLRINNLSTATKNIIENCKKLQCMFYPKDPKNIEPYWTENLQNTAIHSKAFDSFFYTFFRPFP